LLLLLGVVACLQGGDAYVRELHRWHRHGEVFDFNSMRSELIWDAVLITPEMRTARIDREAALRHMSPAQAESMLPAGWRADGLNFYVGFFAPKDVKDLLDPNSEWHVELHDASGHSQAAHIVSLNISSVDHNLFPFLDRWARAYLVTFPSIAPHPLSLTMNGLNVTSTLVWK